MPRVREQKHTLRSSIAGERSPELQYTVELRLAGKLRVIGTSAVLAVAAAIFEAAKRDELSGELVLREGARVLLTWAAPSQSDAQ